MKTLRLLGLALIAVVMCVNFTSCSDDDDETSSIVGTWAYTSPEDGNGKFTFKKDGGLVWEDEEETTSNNTYTLKNDNLKIIFNDNDDYIIGTITFSGNKATYQYTWHDCDGEWDSDRVCTMTLTKQ